MRDLRPRTGNRLSGWFYGVAHRWMVLPADRVQLALSYKENQGVRLAAL